MSDKQTLIQALGEAIIPLLGFFFFDWGLYFILIFYFIDLLVTEFFLHLKIRKIVRYRFNENNKKEWLKKGALSFALMLLLIISTHLAVLFIDPKIDFYNEFKEFVLYEEAGIPIPQGIILLPLVVLGNFQQYRMFFIFPAKFRALYISQLFNLRKKALLLGVAGAGFTIAFSYLLNLPEVIYLLLLIISKFFVDLKMRI